MSEVSVNLVFKTRMTKSLGRAISQEAQTKLNQKKTQINKVQLSTAQRAQAELPRQHVGLILSIQ